MADDDLLREASDPTTPGERLDRILSSARHSFEARVAAAGNASLPTERLAGLLAMVTPLPSSIAIRLAAWRNPSAPLVLLTRPSPDHRVAAANLLHEQGRQAAHHVLNHMQPVTLEALIEGWTQPHVVPERAREVQAFARHLAGLFGLRWPSEG